MILVSGGVQIDDTATRIVQRNRSLIPVSGTRFEPSDVGRTKFLDELLKPENREMRILYALMLAEDEQPRITRYNSRTKAEIAAEAAEEYQTIPLFNCRDGDLALLREHVLTEAQKKGEPATPSNGDKPSN